MDCVRSSPSHAEAEQVGASLASRKRERVKKPIEVGTLGIPLGTMKDQFNWDMKDQFNWDINSFVKEMNPCLGYDKQKQ
jgi:hypothetical protein